MFKYIAVFFVGVLASAYFFPFELAVLPGANTKMLMAAASLVVLGIQLSKKGNAESNRDFLVLTILAALLSLVVLAAVSYNETNDYTYATYVMSMWVWLGGAYLAVSCMRWLHAAVSVRLVANYLIGISVAQCFLALLIDASVPVREFVNTYISGFDWVQLEQLNEGGRLYGIGATLDVAGLRFSVVLAMIAYICMQKDVRSNNVRIVCYLVSFCIIAIVGNMMARTTTVGIVLSLLYWLYAWYNDRELKRVWLWVLAVIGVAVLVSSFLYTTNHEFRENIRFAFEGFFSLWEDGEWDVHSNNLLKNMLVFPDNMKTWLIGDGYIENPYFSDPYYIGPFTGGYYMGTDIGYLRFIFYFGVFGLLLFMLFFAKATQVCIRRFPEYKLFFLMMLAVNYICWCKVSTDIFVVFALFLCVSKVENDESAEPAEDAEETEPAGPAEQTEETGQAV